MSSLRLLLYRAVSA